MAVATDHFTAWLAQANVSAERLTPQQQALLQATFRFRQRQGHDYYSTRLLSHFLLHCEGDLKVAPVARLLGLSRPTASEHQGVSSKEVIQQAHHRLEGRPHGKLLPRYAGPIAQFLVSHPDSTRYDVLGFVEATFGVRVSRVALYKFLKKYGLEQVPGPDPKPASACPPADALPPAVPATEALPEPTAVPAPALAPAPGAVPASAPAPGAVPAPPFSSRGRNTPAPSC